MDNNDPYMEFFQATFHQCFQKNRMDMCYEYAEKYAKYCKEIRFTPEYTNKDRLKNWWYSDRLGVGGGDFAILINIS